MKSLYRYINADGDVIEEQVGDPGNYSIIPEGAVVVQVVERPEAK